ncbi:hypothetical protein [Halobacterium litoreum]|uniref:Uncharacterized protein n=1 Tax=Halobacterium litoreum TaxID=2039234 RepID=A0ABD5NC05_9EURY|nr:hypothetical protein [Halobacterium litoreum]UHH14450.1 hypothetical protein LT972_05490 [Halobacterium litoreum]
MRSRRALLAVAVVAMVATAGCTGGVLNAGGGGSGSGSAQLDSVPASAEFVGYADVDGMVSDDNLRALMNTALETQAEQSEYYDGPTSVEEMLNEAESTSDLSPSKFEDVTFFGAPGEQTATNAEQAGMIVTTDFTEDELVATLEENGEDLSESTYADTTLYTYGFQGQNAMAPLGDGTFALGDEAAVKSVLDVEAGNEEALGGDLRTAYSNTDDGYVKFAMAVPQDQVPADQLDSQSPMNVSAFNSVEFVSGSFSTSGSDVSMDMNMVTDSQANGDRMYDLVDGALQLYSGVGGEEVQEALDKLSVEQSGATVSVTFTDSVSNLEEYIEEMYSTSASGSASSSTGSAGSMTATA